MEGGNGRQGGNDDGRAPSSWTESVSSMASKMFSSGGSSSEEKGKKVREQLVINITDLPRADRPVFDNPIMAADELAPAPAGQANAQPPAGHQ